MFLSSDGDFAFHTSEIIVAAYTFGQLKYINKPELAEIKRQKHRVSSH
jgi:hypothetical protein